MKRFIRFVLWLLAMWWAVYAGSEIYSYLIVHGTSQFGNTVDIAQIDWSGILTFVWPNAGFTAPHAMYSDTTNQVVIDANSWYKIKYNTITDQSYGMVLSWGTGGTDIIFPRAWSYEICFSAIADTDTPNKHMFIRWQRNNINIPSSNTVVQLTNATTEAIISACVLDDFNANDWFSLMLWSDDAGSQILYTTWWINPTRPASPSIITTVKRISNK